MARSCCDAARNKNDVFLNNLHIRSVQAGEHHNNKDMKIVIATIAITLGLLALSQTAEARSPKHCGSSYTYKSGHSSCGCAIYTKRIITGYDCYRRPIYRYCSVPVVHRCHKKHGHHYGHYRPHYSHYNKYSHRYRNYGHYGHHRYRSHFSFSNGYGRISICR